jgi:hypothetical protein
MNRMLLIVFSLLALVAAPAQADRHQLKKTTRTNINGSKHSNVNVNNRKNVNVNSNRRTNVNVDRDIDIDIDVDRRYHGGGYYYNRGPSVAGVVAASVATAIVVGAVYSSLPPNCTTIVANGIAYQNCGGYYYQPQYRGSSVSYVVVNRP